VLINPILTTSPGPYIKLFSESLGRTFLKSLNAESEGIVLLSTSPLSNAKPEPVAVVEVLDKKF